MRLLRNYFLALSLRERLLLTVFIWVGLVLWALALVRHARSGLLEFQRTGVDLSTQEQWYAQREITRTQLQDALRRLDASSTYNAEQLAARLDLLARELSLNYEVPSPFSEQGDQFNVHTVRLQVRKASLKDLIALDASISRERPYMGLEAFQISSNRSDPRNLDAIFQVYSFELKETNQP